MTRGFHALEHAGCPNAQGWDAAMVTDEQGALVCKACGYAADAPRLGTLDDAFDLIHRQWGLRADPHVWRAMKQRLTGVATPDDVEAVLSQAFTAVTGLDLATEPEPMVHLPQLDHGGMSGGVVDLRWWRAKGIPLMVERATRAVDLVQTPGKCPMCDPRPRVKLPRTD